MAARSNQSFKKIVSEASAELQKWAEKELGDPFYFDDKIIYHYTNAVGLLGIIENNCLWATNLSYVNDSRELTLGLSIYQHACERLQNGKHKKELKELSAAFEKRLKHKSITNRYACCFTNNGDQLSQWLGYGSYGLGYAIGFDTTKLLGNLVPAAEASRIIYDKDTQLLFAQKHLTIFFEKLLKSNGKKLQAGTVELFLDLLEQECEFYIMGFKHTGFQEESENRLHVEFNSTRRVNVIERKGILIPYIELQAKKGKKLPIKTITIGPTADFERAEKGVRFLLEKNGFSDVEVRKSEIPFKG